jgi:thioredoxin 1
MVDTKSVIHITDEAFDKTVAQGVTVVDFWADWCMPCRMQGPIIEAVAARMGDQAKVGKLDTDTNPMTPGRFGITGIPTMIFFKDGAEAKRLVGVQSEDTIVDTLNSLL